MSVSTSISLTAHNSHTSCSPSFWVALLLDWMPMDVCYASCCCSFLCSVFIISPAPATMAMTTTPLVTVVCSSTLSLLSIVTMAPSLMGLPVTSGQHDVVLLPPLTPRHSGGVVGLVIVPQQHPPSQRPFQAYANYAKGPPQVGLASHHFVFFIHLLFILVYAFCFWVPCYMPYSPMGAQSLGFAPLQPFGAYPWQTYVQPGDGHWSSPGMQIVAASPTALSRGLPSATQSAVLQPFILYGGAYSFGGLVESPNPSIFPAWWGGVFFSRFCSM